MKLKFVALSLLIGAATLSTSANAWWPWNSGGWGPWGGGPWGGYPYYAYPYYGGYPYYAGHPYWGGHPYQGAYYPGYPAVQPQTQSDGENK